MTNDTDLSGGASAQYGELLVANNQEIAGWALSNKVGQPVLISIYVNNIHLTSVYANRADVDLPEEVPEVVRERSCRFRVTLHETLTNCLPIQNKIEARFQSGQMLSFGKNFVVDVRGLENIGAEYLQEKFDQGSAFIAKSGILIKPISARPGWGKVAVEAYVEATKTVKSILNKDVFIAYGTLLGKIRENGLIGHDDDVDAMFLLDANNAVDAGYEFFEVTEKLKQAGCDIIAVYEGGNFHWRMSNNIVLDIFCCWVCEENICGYMFAFPGSHEDIYPVKSDSLCDVQVSLPASPEKFLSGIYGENWRIPDPYFQWQPDKSVLKDMSAFARGFKRL